MTLINFFKWIGGGVVALIALLCLLLQGVYWYGASLLPNELPQPQHAYPAPARAALWRMLGGGETALAVRKLNIFSYAGTAFGFTASYRASAWTEFPALPADLELLDFTHAAVSGAIRQMRDANSPPAQPPPSSNAETLQQISYRQQIEPLALLIRISREWPAERMADMVLETRDYGRDSKDLEQAARAYFGTAVEDLTQPELNMLVAIGLRSGSFDPHCHPERFVQTDDDHSGLIRFPAVPAISVASLSRLKPVDCKKQS